ncbi:MAG: RHS repeat-associated core domain-containing protein, partial [Planctomycetaceae bacterium]|nr:RHS repeat-associated core domain-containing protein [Planctomycetaceae bacterium]
MGLNPAPSDYSSGIPNVVTYLVVEDTVDSGNTPVQRTIYGLDYRGVALRRVAIDNPLASSLNTVCTSQTYNNPGKVLEQRSSSVHSLVVSNALVTQFLNPLNPSDSTWTNDLATMEPSQGLIHAFEYDTDGNRTSTKLKVGSGGTAYFVSASDFNSNRQETATYIYPTQTANRAASDRVTTTFTYTYWDTEQKVIKTKTTMQQAVPVTQNGSGISAVTNEYYDESGRLRWSRDALGVVTYYGYQPENGLQNVIVKDVNTSSLPSEVL